MTIEALLQTNNELLGQILARLANPATTPPAPVRPETVQPAPKAEKAPAKAPEKPQAAPAEAKGPEYADVRAAALALAKAKPGGNAVTTLLAEFGVDHASKLAPEQWGDFIARAQEASK